MKFSVLLSVIVLGSGCTTGYQRIFEMESPDPSRPGRITVEGAAYPSLAKCESALRSALEHEERMRAEGKPFTSVDHARCEKVREDMSAGTVAYAVTCAALTVMFVPLCM